MTASDEGKGIQLHTSHNYLPLANNPEVAAKVEVYPY